MTVFTGTVNADTFLGADFVADEFHFDPTTLSAGDAFDGGLSAGGGDVDTVFLAGGTYAAADFAGMNGIERITLTGAAILEVDTAMITQAGGGLTVYTSAGDDVIDGSAATAGIGVVLGGGSDTVYGGQGDDSFSIDPFLGGNHSIFAGDGWDYFYIIGVGSHVLDGGGGYDELVLMGNTGAADLDMRAAGINLTVNGGLLQAEVTGIEVVYGTFYDDVLRGDGSDEEIWGLTGDNILDGRGGDDTLFGDIGNDTLIGGAGDDGLAGFGGIDTADYSGSWDDLDIDLERAVDQAIGSGMTGTDTLTDIENVTGGHGADSIAGDVGTNLIRGGAGSDTLFGRDGDDVLRGEGGNDNLDAGSGFGADLLDGGAGLDSADFSAATTGVFVDLASDYGSDGLVRFWTLLDIEGAIGGSGDDALYGDDGANKLDGRQGADDLFGLDGDDQLRGGNGADTLDGGSGDDILLGGSGADLFVISDTGAGFGADTIQDFQDGVDSLELVGVGFAVVNDAGGDAYIDMFDASLAYLDTVRLVGAAGLIDATDYALMP